MQNLHFKLTSKYPQYNNWHQTKHHNKIHWVVFILFTLLVFGTISRWTPTVFAADTVPPTAPTNLTATPISSTQINLSWTASTDDVGVAGYKIYRCAGSGCAPTTQIATSATNSYSDTGLTASTAYTYAVSAYDAAGNESGKSGTAPPPAGSYYVASDGSDANSGGVSSPFKTIAKALSLAKVGETVYLRAGAYSELVSFPIAGTSDTGRITLKAYNQEAVTITQTGRVMNIGQPYISVEGIVFDANWGDDDAVKIYSTANFAILRGLEVRNTRRDAIDMASPQGVLIENSKIHDAIWVDGNVRNDAHGIVTSGVKDLTIRGVEIYYVSGDAIQFQYGGWNNILIENSTLWNGPLPTARGGATAGVYPGENAVDTKYYLVDGRGKLTIRNVTAYGWKSDYLVNAAAFNLKHNVEVTLDGITTYDNDIAFRLRGPSPTYGEAWITLKNAVIYDSNRGVRYEDKIENLHIYHTTLGKGITALFENASGYGVGFEAKNNLFLAAVKPVEAGDPSNFAAVETDFKNPASYDYHLNASASTIDKGITIPEVTTDREGMTRPQGMGVDPGAYEYQGAGSAPIPAWVDPKSPLANKEHPRLFFTANDLSALKDKLKTQYKTEFQLFINTMDSHFNDDIAAKTRLYMTYDAMNYAFLYLVDPGSLSSTFIFGHTRDEYGSKAIAHALQIAKNAINTPYANSGGWNDNGYSWTTNSDGGPINMAMALAYDWAYPLLTIAEKQAIADGVIHTFNERKIEDTVYLNSNNHGVTQNGNYGALAIWGDNIDVSDSTYYSDIMQAISDKIEYDWLERFYDFSNYIFKGSAGWPESTGSNYNHMGFINMSFFTGAISSALNKDYFYQVDYFHYHPLYLLANIRPFYDGKYYWYKGDDQFSEPVSPWENKSRHFHTLIGLSRSDPDMASLTKWMIDKSFLTRGQTFGTGDESIQLYYLLYNFVWGDKNVIGKSPTELNIPLSNRLGLDQYVMRQGYDNPSDTMVVFNAPKFHMLDGGHAHSGDFASFTIEKFGNLAINGSKNKGFVTKFGGGLTKNSMFYNTVGVYKPGELIRAGTEYYNVMGYRANYSTAGIHTDPAFQNNGTNHVGSVIAEKLNSGSYDYISYDYTRSWYNSQTTSNSAQFKVDFANREFVYFRSAGGVNDEYVVVFDRINSVDPSYTKRWFLQTSFEVDSQGGTWSVDPSRVGQTYPGKWNLNGSDTVKVTNTYNGSHGRLFSKTLLPTSFQISKVGGPGHYVEDAEGKVAYDGYDGKFTDDYKDYFGSFRIEVESKTGKKDDLFLHVLQFGDSNTLNAMNNTSRIDGDTMVGTLIDDPATPRIVMFSKDSTGATVSSVTYTADYPSTLTGKHLLADITAGTYDIYKNGTRILTGIASQTGKNTLSFESTGGLTFQIVKTGEAPPATDTQAPSIPTNLTASVVSSSQINLSWIASTDPPNGGQVISGVTGYKIYRCAGSTCAPTTQIATSATNSYSDTGLTASTAYTYTVSAYDAAGNESGKSTAVSATTLSQFKQADFNKDGIVNQLDFDILEQDWSRTDKPVSDLNQDGIVDSRDLGIMMSSWEN